MDNFYFGITGEHEGFSKFSRGPKSAVRALSKRKLLLHILTYQVEDGPSPRVTGSPSRVGGLVSDLPEPSLQALPQAGLCSCSMTGYDLNHVIFITLRPGPFSSGQPSPCSCQKLLSTGMGRQNTYFLCGA